MWHQVKGEILNPNMRLEGLSDLALDTLYGSMWGLNHRYTSLKEVMQKDRQKMILYSVQRLNQLINEPAFTFKQRESFRCNVGYGTYGWKYDPKLIELALKYCGIIDTAEGYGYGRVETELGKILKDYPHADINTKVRRDHMSPEAILNCVNRSIKKLNVIPHVQLHFPNDRYPLAVKYLADLRKRGEIKSIGLSNCSVDMIESAQSFLSDYSGDVINSVQMSFSLVDQRIRKVLLPYCQERGIVVMAYSPLGQKYDRLKSKLLSHVAKQYNATEAQVALSWLLSFNGVIPIPQTNDVYHFYDNIESNNLVLDQDEVDELTEYYEIRNI
jgi:diketogulonate reductase-like aldo/keto reductase